MPFDSLSLVKQITDLQHQTVAHWHEIDPDNPFEGLMHTVCQQHQFNFLLWHEEDIARSPNVGDARIAQVKRAIDSYNQQRNDYIERVDEAIIGKLVADGVEPNRDARINTETPGSAIDRLSIMSLRIYHMNEQLDRDDADNEHRQKVEERLARCHLQHADLSQSLVELLDDLKAGTKMLKVYRQMKMYNDPTLNPYLYQQSKRAA